MKESYVNPRHCNRLILDSTRVGWAVWWRVVRGSGREGEHSMERGWRKVYSWETWMRGLALELGWG